MKMKKLVALGAAAAMSMTMCVNVFADSEVKNAVNAGYAGAQASYTGTISAANGTQMTVVVLKAIAQDATLSNDDIEYINQDVAASALYTNMGTKTDLLAVDENGTATYAGDYVIRVGYYDAEGAWNVAEGTFTIDTKANETGKDIDIVWGDVDFSGGSDLNDALYILAAKAGGKTVVGDNNVEQFAIGSNIVDSILWGDVDFSGGADLNDALYVLAAKAGGKTVVGDNNTNAYAIGSKYTINIAN